MMKQNFFFYHYELLPTNILKRKHYSFVHFYGRLCHFPCVRKARKVFNRGKQESVKSQKQFDQKSEREWACEGEYY